MERAVFASLLADRKMATCLCGAAAVHLGLTASGLPAWQCPLLAAFGVPCPGCGLSRAAVALLHGEVARAFTLHAFAPALVGALALLLAAALLGSRPRRTVVNAVRRVEERTGITLWLLGAIIVYWALRFSLDGQRVFQLVP
jgi:hypothetical protein